MVRFSLIQINVIENILIRYKFIPINTEFFKDLLEIHGETIIERQSNFFTRRE